MTDYKSMIETCEAHLREGKGHLATQILGEIRVSEIPRPFKLPLANICRRLNLLALGLKVLNPVTGPDSPVGDEPPTARELAEYAVLLERCGAVREALQVLGQVNSKEAPDAYLYRAFCHFKSWDYGAAIPELSAYVKAMESPYQRLVGQVNLAAAYVVEEKYDLALELLKKNIAWAHEHNFQRLKGNCFELRAQVLLHRRDFAGVRDNLTGAEKIFASEKTVDQFFVHKWKSILMAFEENNPDGLLLLRKEATARSDWESVREADLFRLQIRFDEKLLSHLYIGTPFAGYRRRIESFLGRRPRSEAFLYGHPDGEIFDVRTGTLEGREGINGGKLIHRAVAVLLHDLYRPLRVGGIFAEVFPKEKFDVYSSPRRVHQLQFRIRQWIEEKRLPVELIEEKNCYRFAIKGKFAFKVSADENDLSGWRPLWHRLQEQIQPDSQVTASDVRNVLQLKPASCKRFLNWALDNRLLQRFGDNNRSFYRMRLGA